MESLRNISETYLAIRDELFQTADEETGEFDTALLERLNSIQESFEVKAQNCALVCLELHDRSEAIEKEIKRLQTLLKRAKKGEEWLRGYLPIQCNKRATNELRAIKRTSRLEVLNNAL